MNRARGGLRSGEPRSGRLTVRTVTIPDPNWCDAKAVHKTQRRLGVGLEVFAHLLGVSVRLVKRWEQGTSGPSDPSGPSAIACRLLEEINRDPVDFVKRHVLWTAA